MKFFVITLLGAFFTLLAHTKPTGTLVSLPKILPRHPENAPALPPADLLCSPPVPAFNGYSCTFIYEFFGDYATAFIADKKCYLKDSQFAPPEVASSTNWSYLLPGCNTIKLNQVVKEIWEPTNQEYFMPIYQADGQVTTAFQRGPSIDIDYSEGEKCTLRTENLSGGALYAWMCPFKCEC